MSTTKSHVSMGQRDAASFISQERGRGPGLEFIYKASDRQTTKTTFFFLIPYCMFISHHSKLHLPSFCLTEFTISLHWLPPLHLPFLSSCCWRHTVGLGTGKRKPTTRRAGNLEERNPSREEGALLERKKSSFWMDWESTMRVSGGSRLRVGQFSSPLPSFVEGGGLTRVDMK